MTWKAVYYSIEYIQQNIKVSKMNNQWILQDVLLYIFSVLGYSRKKTNRGVLRKYFCRKKNPGYFSFLTTPGSFRQNKASPLWELHKIVLRPKTKNLGNSTQFVLVHPRKFPAVFNYSLEIPLCISLAVPPGNSIFSPSPCKLSR